MKPRSVESMYFTRVTREPLFSKDTEEIFTLLVSLLGTRFLLLTADLSSQQLSYFREAKTIYIPFKLKPYPL